MERLGRDAEQFTKELHEIVGRLAKIDTEKAQAESNLAQLRAKRTEAEAAVANKTAEIADLARKAAGVGERPPQLPASSVADLQRDLEQKTQRARKEAEGKKSPDEIVKQYEEAASKFAGTEEALNSLNLIAEKLSVMYNARVLHYKALRKIYSTRTSLLFMDYISQRGYGGALAYDHAEQRLTIDVDVDASQAAEARRSVFSLSGGERMFSTVAFLLSMWMMVEAPFYALDEFDVFMDVMHRTEALRLLTNHARGAAVSKQFIFISPQSQDGIPKGNDSRTFVLHKPTRGGAQGTLDNVVAGSSQASQQ